MKNYEDAIEDYTFAIKFDPQYVIAYDNRETCYNLLGNYADAIADYSSAIEADPEFETSYANLGKTYDNLARYDEALVSYRRYLDLAGADAVSSIVERVRELELATPTPAA